MNGDAENAGPVMSSLRDLKCSTEKCRTKNAGVENAGPAIQIICSTSRHA